jgi:phosphatidylinositol dimannoside acyltransferase
MDLQKILNSRESGLWALRICRVLPPQLGHVLSNTLADRIAANPQLPLVQAVRLNRWVVSGGKMESEELDVAVRQTLRHIARSFYQLFHKANRPEALQKSVVFNDRIDELIAASRENRCGVMVTGVHLGNFDLVMQAAGWRGLQALAISLPENTEHPEAVEWQHGIRRQTGLEIRPASFGTFRAAIRRMREGGAVLTGIDRPLSSPRYQPRFFGRPASVPVHHVQLALEAGVPVVVMATSYQGDGLCHIQMSPEIQMRRFSDREQETLFNAEQVLEAARHFIQLAPEQWSVLQPVWPDALSELP